MSVHIKIILLPQPLTGAALARIQAELGGHLSEWESKIAAGEPLVNRQPPHHQLEDFIESTGRLVHVLDSLDLQYQAWINGEPVTPHHLRTTLSHKHHILRNLHENDERHHRPSLEED